VTEDLASATAARSCSPRSRCAPCPPRRVRRERAKQFFAASAASSAGVERVFSAAGKMHGDLRKSGKAEMLEHSIIAAHNTD